jgi:hypothetical protein
LSLPPEIGNLCSLRELSVRSLWQVSSASFLTVFQLVRNQLSCLPEELGKLGQLRSLDARYNALASVPGSLGALERLRCLVLYSNQLSWLPIELDQLSESCRVELENNPLPISVGFTENGRPHLRELFARTTHIGAIRARATEICVGLQELELPALLSLLIIDAAVPANAIRMWAKWELVTKVKHFHQRRANCDGHESV